ncbi:MAG: outer membrane protein [Burkholderiaceae bacterium]
MKQTLIAGAVAAAATLIAGPAFSQTYLGAGIGVNHSNRACGAVDATGAAVDSCDKNATAVKIYGGYQLPGTPWAGELTYYDLGRYKASGAFGDAHAKGQYWGIGGAYRPDFGNGWGGVARIGAAYGQGKVDYSLAGSTSGSDTRNDWHPYYGLGVNYALTKQVKLEADWDNTRLTTRVPGFSAATSTVNSFTLGASYAF